MSSQIYMFIGNSLTVSIFGYNHFIQPYQYYALAFFKSLSLVYISSSSWPSSHRLFYIFEKVQFTVLPFFVSTTTTQQYRYHKHLSRLRFRLFNTTPWMFVVEGGNGILKQQSLILFTIVTATIVIVIPLVSRNISVVLISCLTCFSLRCSQP